MRIEGNDHRLTIKTSGQFTQTKNDGLMSEMHAIEGAGCDNGKAKRWKLM
jgi:hypothetical protein